MPQKLSESQLKELTKQVEAGGVDAARKVYDQLYAGGYNYAGWASGVARGNSVSGQSALSFLKGTALLGLTGQAAQSMSDNAIDTLRVNMALGYLSTLTASAGRTGFVDVDVDYFQTRKFHETAFLKSNLTLDNWTLEVPMALIGHKNGSAKVEELWTRIRDTGGDGLDGALAGLALLNQVGLIASTSPNAADRQLAGQWLDRTPGIVNFAQMGSLLGVMKDAAIESVSQAVKSVIDIAWTSANGTPQNVKADNKMIGADVGVWNLYRKGSVDLQFFQDFTRWSSNEWLNGSSTTGFQSTATFGLQPSGEFGYKPPSSGFWAPIGAFYDSQSEKFNAAAGIAAYLPVVLDANLKAVTAEQLGALDVDHDGKLSVVESAGLKFWRDVNEQGLADDGEIGAVDRVISAADFGLYTQGNGNASSSSASSAARQELAALRLETPWRLAAPSRVEAQPWKEERGFGFSFSLDNASSLRRWDTRYTVNANTWIDWRADQIMITSDKTKLVGTDGNDRFDASYYASYTQYFNVDLLTRFYAGAGNDLMGGSVRADELFGGTGNDTLWGYQGNDTLKGEEGADEIQGDQGNDSIDGGADADRLFGQVGNDTLIGGDGNDVMLGFTASNDAKQSLAAGETDDDKLYGDAGNDGMYGGLGNDYLDGGTGNDAMLGEAGNDTLFGGEGVDELQGGAGNDKLLGEAGDDKMFGQAGNDTLWGGAGNDLMMGFTGANEAQQTLNAGETDDDAMYGEAGADRLFGGVGHDTLDGGADNDEVLGDDGNDSLLGQAGDDQLEGGRGNDSLDGGEGHDVLLGDEGNDLVLGANGNDELQGNAGDDKLLGEAGNDRLFGQAGNDTLLGGDGNDVMVGFAASNDTKQTLASGETDDDVMLGERGNDDMYGGLGNDSMDGGVGDDVMLGEAGNDQLQGGDGSDELQGNEGDDQLAGGTGDDRLFGQVGNDTLMGGDGNDVLTGFTAANESKQSLAAGETDDDALYGGAGSDILKGGVGQDSLFGGTGRDELQGGAGNDALYGEEDADNLFGQAGNDTLVGGAGDDYLIGFTASNEAKQTLDAGETDDDKLFGGAGRDTLVGGVGNDHLDGGADADVMVGGKGDDTYVVNSVNDSVYEGKDEGHDVVVSSTSYLMNANIEELRLVEGFAAHGTGNALDNKIIGNSADNILDGITGADTLVGAAGNDTYYVDNAGDKVVEVANEGVDTVQTSVNYTLGANVENMILLDFAKPEQGLVDGKSVLVYGYPKRNELDYMQGDAVANYQGTCALTSIANLLTQTGRPTTESQVVTRAIANNWAVNDPTLPAAQLGGSNVADQQHLLDSYGVRNDVVAGYNEGGIANLVRSGRGVIIAVNAGKLWDDAAYTGNGSVNHAVTLTGAVYDATTGDLAGFYLTDSGRGKVGDMTRYLSVEAFRAAANVANAYAIYTIEPVKYWEENIAGTGNALDNTLVGNRGDNLLAGLGGNDTLEGGAGSDTYQLGRGDGTDRIVENDATAGHRDVAQFSPDVASDQLWFRKTGNDLEVSIVGSDDRFVIDNWYGGAEHRVEQFKAGDGKWLSDSGVQSLVDAMASFSPPAAGEINLPPNHHASLQTQIAANWH